MSQSKKRALPTELELVENKKPERGVVCLPSRQCRLVKRRKTEDSPSQLLEAKAGVRAKQRQVWTAEAREAFFQGLYQYGKDFQQILEHILTRARKKKGDSTIPNLNKNQVRFFYYRTWHKVSAMLTDHQSAESRRPRAMRLPPSLQPAVLSDEEGENALDSSMEEPESPRASVEGTGGRCSPAVTEEGEMSQEREEEKEEEKEEDMEEEGEEGKEGDVCQGGDRDVGGASPRGTALPDKVDGRKESVWVNGARRSLDLVALICYSKLKKKCPGDHNLGKRLSELVYHGTTTIPSRTKGKRRVQIKIPNCRALQHGLKPVAEFEEPNAESDLFAGDSSSVTFSHSQVAPLPHHGTPHQLMIELVPFSSFTWLQIQVLSQNPRLRVTMGSAQRLSQLQSYLACKWGLPPTSPLTLFSSPQPCPPSSGQQATTVGTEATGTEATGTEATGTEATGTEVTAGSSLYDTEQVAIQSTSNVAMPTPSRSWVSLCGGSPLPSGLTVGMLYHQLKQPPCLRLAYELPGSEGGGALKTTLQLAQFISQSEQQQQPPSPSHFRAVIHSSPEVQRYISSLASRSPRKSPLAKYWRLRRVSPHRSTLRPAKRVRLNFTPEQSTATDTSPDSQPAKNAGDRTSVPFPLGVCHQGSSQLPNLGHTHPLTPPTPLLTSNQVQKNSHHTAQTSGLCDIHTAQTSVSHTVQPSAPHVSRTALLSDSRDTFSNLKLLELFSAASQSGSTKSIEIRNSLLEKAKTVSSQVGVVSVASPSPSSSVAVMDTPTTAQAVPTTLLSSIPSPAPPSVVPLLPAHRSPAGTAAIAHPVSVVSALKPFSKPTRRAKKPANRSGQARQLVPRPLLFLPKASAVGKATAPPTGTRAQTPPPVSSSVSGASHAPSFLHGQLLALVQNMILQKLRTMPTGASKPSQTAATESIAAKNPVPEEPADEGGDILSEGEAIPESAVQGALLENFLAECPSARPSSSSSSSSSSELFHTSSDTVNELLRGLSSRVCGDSIARLTKDTADVLPSFAKALGAVQDTSALTPSQPDAPTASQLPVTTLPPSQPPAYTSTQTLISTLTPSQPNLTPTILTPSQPTLTSTSPPSQESLSDLGTNRAPEGTGSEASSLSFLNDNSLSLSALLGTPHNNSPTDFTDLFSLLNQTAEDTDGDHVDGDAPVDIPEESPEEPAKPHLEMLHSSDPTYRSLLEEASVDYIHKFQEMASKMNSLT